MHTDAHTYARLLHPELSTRAEGSGVEGPAWLDRIRPCDGAAGFAFQQELQTAFTQPEGEEKYHLGQGVGGTQRGWKRGEDKWS